MLKVKNLHKVFNANTVNENKIFNGLDLEVKEGDFISIIGSNGAGKSTLLNIISGNLEAEDGSIILDGKEVFDLDEYKRSKDIGRVFQNPSLGIAPNMTILENLALADNKGKFYGLTKAINKDKIEEYKKFLAIADLQLEEKLYTKVGLLSGGQRQALTLLMAVMKKPKILLLDEHTAALDPKTSEKVMDITRRIVAESNITTLMVTHNMKYALNSGNRLFMMHRGDIVVDVNGKEKKELNQEKLLALFEKVHITEELSDRTLLA